MWYRLSWRFRVKTGYSMLFRGIKSPIECGIINLKQIGDDIKFELNCGDIYIMSEKASGFDWKFRNKKHQGMY